VRFFDGTTLLGTSPVVGGVAGLALFAPRLGDRSLTAVYKGDGKFFGSISAVQTLRVVATAKPTITSIRDVTKDEGGEVMLRFRASPLDYYGSGRPITSYYLYRKTDESALAAGAAHAMALAATPAEQQAAQPEHALIAGWNYLLSVPATTDAVYETVVPTLADSNASGFHRATFMVRAATATASVYYDSAPDSGYSVDNLPPAPPSGFAGTYAAGATHLNWNGSNESDLWYYRLYRGKTSSFAPGTSSWVANTTEDAYVDNAGSPYYYKLSAVDVNGNESGFAALQPEGTVDVAEAGPVAFALSGVQPNPTLGERLSVAFALPDGASAKLELLDVSGRRVMEREVGSLGAGRHVVDLAEGRHVAPGLYLLRLVRGPNVRVTRVAVLK
jgi:hypothetical protein